MEGQTEHVINGVSHHITIFFFSMEKFNQEAAKRARENFLAARQIPRIQPYQWLNPEYQERLELFLSFPLIVPLAHITEDLTNDQIMAKAAQYYASGVPVQYTSESPYPPMAVFPGGAPIIDHLAYISSFPDAWPCFPPALFRDARNQRTFSFSDLQSVDAHNITIGISTPDTIRTTSAWLREKLKVSQFKYGVKWAPVIMETCQVTYSELEPIYRKETDQFILNNVLHEDWLPDSSLFPNATHDDHLNFPLAMFISDGQTFNLQIRFDVRFNPAGDLKFFAPKDFVTPVFDLLSTVDCLLVGDQRIVLDRFFRLLSTFAPSSSTPQLPPIINISVLATVAGIDPRFTPSAAALSLHAVGFPVDPFLLTSDAWVGTWDSHSVPCKIVSMAFARILNLSAFAYHTAIIHELFPSVDLTAHVTQMMPREFVAMFHTILTTMLKNTVRYRTDPSEPLSRSTLKLYPSEDLVPNNLRDLASRLGQGPSVTAGLARTLTMARHLTLQSLVTLDLVNLRGGSADLLSTELPENAVYLAYLGWSPNVCRSPSG